MTTKTEVAYELLETVGGYFITRGGKQVARVLTKEDAEMIWRVLNSHVALLDVAYRVIPYFEDLIEDAGGEEGPGRYYKSVGLKSLLKLIKEAITQAEPK